MHVCNLVDPSVEANIFFEKEEVTEKGKLDFEKKYTIGTTAVVNVPRDGDEWGDF